MGSPAVAVASPRKSPSSMRRTNKPLVEKKRRARINGCLGQLKSLILSAMNTEGTQVSRLEKADILEMTVKYLRHVQDKQQANATSSMTSPSGSEPEVVAKFSAGYSECASEVIRYMDSVTGVTADVRTRLESHLVSRLHGSGPNATGQQQQHGGQVAHSRPEVGLPGGKQMLGNVTSTSNSTSRVDELSLHYQTAVELANMASNIAHTHQSLSEHSGQDSYSNCDKSEMSPAVDERQELSPSPERSSPYSNQIPIDGRDNSFNRPRSSSSVDSTHSFSSDTTPHWHRQQTPTRYVPGFTNDNRISSENTNLDFNTAPTPPDTPPHMDLNNNISISLGPTHVVIKEREISSAFNSAQEANERVESSMRHVGNSNFQPMQRREEEYASRDYVIIKNVSHPSYSHKDTEVVESMECETYHSDLSPHAPSRGGSMDAFHRIDLENNGNIKCRRNYDLTSFQQPLHIHIPDSPTLTTTPSPPQLMPSHPTQGHYHKQCNRPIPTMHHPQRNSSNNPNAGLPTILYGGVNGNGVVTPSAMSAFPNRHSEVGAHPLQALKAMDGYHHHHHHQQNTCSSGNGIGNSLDETCSNNGSRSQFFKQRTWTQSEHLQDTRFQGHSEHVPPQQHHQRSLSFSSSSSSTLSPPILVREDLLASHAHPSTSNKVEEREFPHSHTASSSFRQEPSTLSAYDLNNSNDDNNNNNANSSRRLTFNREDGVAKRSAFYNRKRADLQRFRESEKNCIRNSVEECNDIYTTGSCFSNQARSPLTPSPSQHNDSSSCRSPSPYYYNQVKDEFPQEEKYHHRYNEEQCFGQSEIENSCRRFSSNSNGTIPSRQLQDFRDNPRIPHQSSSPSSSSTSSSPCSSPPGIFPAHDYSDVPHPRVGMRPSSPLSEVDLHHVTQGHPLAKRLGRHHASMVAINSNTGNLNGLAATASTSSSDPSRQNACSPLSPPTLKKRVMRGHGSQVSFRPHCTDARPASGLMNGRSGGEVRDRDLSLSVAIPVSASCRLSVPQATPYDYDFESATMEHDGAAQMRRGAVLQSTEERLWRPW